MTDRPPLNPFETPRCEIYDMLYYKWWNLSRKGKSWMSAYNKMSQHRASCPTCQARMREATELARTAVHPEVKK